MTIPRRWKTAFIFWELYTVSVAFYKDYPWVDTIWMAVSVLGVLSLSMHLLVKEFGSGGDARIHGRSRLGYPKWLIHFLRDDGEKTRKPRKPQG